jgi:hypothetical protein
MDYDVFISHASEDKEAVARPLAAHLVSLGLRVWLDEFELTLGDNLRRKIDHGLSRSKYGLVILSPEFLLKEWPNKELDGLVAREEGRDKVVLPIWHNVSAADILKFSPLLAGRVAVSTSQGLAHVASRVFDAVRRDEFTVNPQTSVKETEADLLRRLRSQMLISKSASDLRSGLYEMEAYLSLYPHSPEARLLKDRMEFALQVAEDRELPRASAPMEYRRLSAMRPILWILILGSLAAVIYAVLRLIGIL